MAAAYLLAPEAYVDHFCQKAGFDSRKQALLTMKYMQPNRNVSFIVSTKLGKSNTYLCRYCSLWHIGHR